MFRELHDYVLTHLWTIGLRGKSDQLVYAYAQQEKRILITCDMGFSNILKFPPIQSIGLLVVRISDHEPIERFNDEVLRTVMSVGENLVQHLAIVEIGKARLRQ